MRDPQPTSERLGSGPLLNLGTKERTAPLKGGAGRTPFSGPKRRRRKPTTPEERAQAAERQREKRRRDRKDIVPFPGRASPAFIEAMKARARYYGATKQEAEAAAADPKQIAALAFAVLDEFAAHWYERKTVTP